MIKHNFKTIGAAITMLLLLVLAGCATTPTAKLADQIKLQGVDSSSAWISRLYLIPTDGKLLLRGEVSRRIHLHGQIPGHLHVQLISPQGKVIKEVDIGYTRRNDNNHNGNFQLLLPAGVEPGSTIRVTHHDPVSHMRMADPTDEQWRDIDPGQ